MKTLHFKEISWAHNLQRSLNNYMMFMAEYIFKHVLLELSVVKFEQGISGRLENETITFLDSSANFVRHDTYRIMLQNIPILIQFHLRLFSVIQC